MCVSEWYSDTWVSWVRIFKEIVYVWGFDVRGWNEEIWTHTNTHTLSYIHTHSHTHTHTFSHRCAYIYIEREREKRSEEICVRVCKWAFLYKKIMRADIPFSSCVCVCEVVPVLKLFSVLTYILLYAKFVKQEKNTTPVSHYSSLVSFPEAHAGLITQEL